MGNLSNFATALIATAPSPATSGTTLSVEAGKGFLFPLPPFYGTAHPKNNIPEIVGATQAEALQVTAVPRTTIAAGSNGASLPQATINVVDASSFASTGTASVLTANGYQAVTYTGKSGTTLTGCTGGTGAMSTGGAVVSDTFTIVRAQKTSTAQTITAPNLWRFSNTIFTEDMFNGSVVENETPGGTINGVTTVFITASSQKVTGTLKVYKNGIRLKAGGADFTETSTGFTMVTAPATGTVLLCDYRVGGVSDYNVGSNSFVSDETPTGLINSSNTTYSAFRGYVANSLEVYINGLKQIRGVDYTEATPSTGAFTITAAPFTGDNLRINYQYNLNPSSNADTVDGYHADDLMPVASLMCYASDTLPSANWLLCYGQAISRATYALLFSRLGIVYGVGDGSTTFNVPDMRGRVPAGQDDMGGTSANRLTNPASTIGGLDGDVLGGIGGSETHVITTAQLASHTHAAPSSGSFLVNTGSGTIQALSGGTANSLIGATASTGSDSAHNNVQPTIILNYIIKVL